MKKLLATALAIALLAGPALAQLAPGPLPGVAGPNGPLTALPVVNLGYDSVTGFACIVGKTPTCLLAGAGGGGGGSLSAKANTNPQTGVDGTSYPLSLTTTGLGLRFTPNEPTTGGDISFLDTRPVATTLTAADAATTSTVGMNGAALVTGAPTANSTQDNAVNAQGGAALTVVGTGTFSGVIESSFDGGGITGHFVATSGIQRGATTAGTPPTTSVVNGNAVVDLVAQNATNIRYRLTSCSSCSVSAQFTFSSVPGSVKLTNPVSLTGSCIPYHGASGGSAASANPTLVSALTRTVCGEWVMNTSTTIAYLKDYDLVAAPTCSSATGLKHVYPIPPAAAAGQVGGFIIPIPGAGETRTLGWAYCIVGGPTDTDSSNAPTGVFVEGSYKQ